jgi:hypothetical protein
MEGEMDALLSLLWYRESQPAATGCSEIFWKKEKTVFLVSFYGTGCSRARPLFK